MLNALILTKQKKEILLLLEEIFFNDIYSLENLKNLSIRIYVLIDRTYGEFNISSPSNLSSNVFTICNSNNQTELFSLLSNDLEILLARMHHKYNLYSPITLESLKYINEFYFKDISIKDFSNRHNINSSYFGRKFNSEVGLTFSDYLNKKRSHEAKKLIFMSNLSIKEISFKVGYIDISHFYKNFKKNFGISPAKYRDLKDRIKNYF